MNGENVETEIRHMAVSNAVSPVATIPQVRSRLVALQQQMGKEKGIVMDGRDIGTTVFPDAEMKVFVGAIRTDTSPTPFFWNWRKKVRQ